jgi:hypothetical protein
MTQIPQALIHQDGTWAFEPVVSDRPQALTAPADVDPEKLAGWAEGELGCPVTLTRRGEGIYWLHRA